MKGLAVTLGILGFAFTSEAHAQCQEWSEEFGIPGAEGLIETQAIFDDGSGPALFVAGDFNRAGNVIANNIAKWDGTSWSPLGLGVNGQALAMTVHDDGSGPALFVAGLFANAGAQPVGRIAKWNGTSWPDLAGGTTGSILALEVYDDGSGSGPALYAAGGFLSIGGVAASDIAKWDGSSWTPLGVGLSRSAHSLCVADVGNGPRLYVGGGFICAGGQVVNRLASWDGTNWYSLGGAGGTVRSLFAFDDGTGMALYAGGMFKSVDNMSAPHIAKWDGTTWFPLSSGVAGAGTLTTVESIAAFDDGSGAGPALHIGGEFTMAGTSDANGIAKWDGTSWSPLGEGVAPHANSLVVFDSALWTGPRLYVGGILDSANGADVKGIAVWDEERWSGIQNWYGLGDGVSALAAHDDGSGSALYAGGSFDSGAGLPKGCNIAKWNGSQWSEVGGGTNDWVASFTEFDDGQGTKLYAAGDFIEAGGTTVNRIARWDGVSWSALGTGMDRLVFALTVYDDDGPGPGAPRLIAGGRFDEAGGIPAESVAAWDGSSWSPMPGLRGTVIALAVFDDGVTRGLFAGGDIFDVGGQPAAGIARWDGSSWSNLGSRFDGTVLSLVTHDDGSGPALYAAGEFASVQGPFSAASQLAAANIARWNGTAWSTLGTGTSGRIQSIALFDDGSGAGAQLYAGGYFLAAGGTAAARIARWDGSDWHRLAQGLDAPASIVAAYDDGSSSAPALYVGGSFRRAGGKWSEHIAKWSNPCPAANADGQRFCAPLSSECESVPRIEHSGHLNWREASDIFITARGVQAGQRGVLVVSGANTTELPFRGNSLCIDPDSSRVSPIVRDTHGTPGACDGTLTVRWNALRDRDRLQLLGETLHCQFVGLNATGSSSVLTEAIELQWRP